jgi:protein O-mannosyl-transferase
MAMARPWCPVWLMAVSLGLVTIALYWPATGHDFVNYDDPDYVTENPHVRGGLNWAAVKWAFTNPVCCNYHPLTVLSHMLDCQLFGLNPWGHHLINVVLHALNAILVFVLLQHMTGARWRSLIVAALFAVHPLRVESVAWVAERKDVLSACFGFLALIFYSRYAEGRRHKTGIRSQRSEFTDTHHGSRITDHPFIFYLLSLCFLALGLMSKPMLVTWPFLMLLLDFWPLHRVERSTLNPQPSTIWGLVIEKIPFLALAVAASFVTFVMQGDAIAAAQGFPLAARSGNALISYCRYLGRLSWPTDLAVFYPHPGQWPMAKVLLAGGLILGISGLFFVQRRRFPFLLVGWLWFCGTLVPVIGLVQVGGQAMADRYSYIPSLGVLLLAVWGTAELTTRCRNRQTVLAITSTIALAAFALATHFQLKHWKDSLTLFSHAIAVTRNNALAEGNLGNALGARGHRKEAIPHFQEALRLYPLYAEAHLNFGVALVEEGRIDEGIEHYRAAIKARPNYAQAHRLLAGALALEDKHDEAKKEFLEALRLKPDYPEAHARLGHLLLLQGAQEEGLRHLFEAIRIRDDCENGHYYLASALARQGRMQEAVVHFRAAVRVRPDHAAALNDLSWILATERAPGLRNVTEAIRLATRACEVSAHTNAAFLDTLGTALFEAGRCAEAIEVTQKAATIAAAAGQQKLASQIRSHLQLYRTKPAHE